jgi:nitrite reductase/ring-hydroxylating ferredoxin subunit
MLGRQAAIDALNAPQDQTNRETVLLEVGEVDQLDKARIHSIQHNGQTYCVAHHKGEWFAYSALCPHQLGSLEGSPVTKKGVVVCPWHGYRFDIRTGQNLDKKCGPLQPRPAVFEKDGVLFAQIDVEQSER